MHDSKHIDQLTEDETSGRAVYADSAYMDKKRSARLKGKGVHDGIIQRRVRGQDELRPEQKAHNQRCAKIRAIVTDALRLVQARTGRSNPLPGHA